MTILKSAETDKSDQTNTLIVSKNVALDLKNRKMEMNNKILFRQSTGQSSWPLIENSIFIDNNTVYIQGLFPDEPLIWTKTGLTDPIWQMQNLTAQILDLIDADNATVLNPEIIRINDLETPCDVLKINPDLNKLWEFLEMQPGTGLPSTLPEGVSYQQVVKNCDISLWISRSSRLPVQSVIKVNITSPTSTTTMDVNLKLEFYDFNKPVFIQVTPEALAAKELNLQKP
jgi:hypothetical protein